MQPIQRAYRRHLLRKTLLRPKKTATLLAYVSKRCCLRIGVSFFGGNRLMFSSPSSRSGGQLLQQRYKAVARQLLMGSLPLAAAIEYEMALVKCSSEHLASCRGRNALQLREDIMGRDPESEAKLLRIYTGCSRGQTAWDFILYGLSNKSAGAAAFMMYDVVEVLL